MNIAIDIDDTLTESFDYFQPMVAEYFGVTLESLKERNISHSNFPEEWKSRELEFCRAYFDRYAADTPFKPDAAWGVNALRRNGHRIVIITGRSYTFYTDPYKTTERELRNGHITYDKLICTLDKGTACKEEKIDIFIDDLPANCDAAEKAGAKAFLFESKANKDLETAYRKVKNWKEVVDAVNSIP